MLAAHWVDWLNLFIRWFHITAGIAWIGASFYFNWLENHLIRTGQQKPGISGYLWAIHGGGIYRLEKYTTAPETMPETLHWFKWEAYVTWLTGMALLFVQYYWNANLYLIDPSVMALTPFEAIMMSLVVIILSWLVYHHLSNALEQQPLLLVSVGLMVLGLAAYGLTHVFSGRGAFIHVGVIIGTAMVGNVAHVIMPSQRALLAAVEKGEEPDKKYGAKALLRSRHNNYLTLPILFIMISSHYPITYGSEWNWLILLALMLSSAGIRHYFNIRHKEEHSTWILPVAALFMLSLVWVTQPSSSVPVSPSASVPTSVAPSSSVAPKPDQPITGLQSSQTDLSRAKQRAPMLETERLSLEQSQVKTIIEQRCVSCHSATPSSPIFNAPPAGVILDTMAQITQHAPRIYQQAVAQKIMPLGNMTKMEEEERVVLGEWYQRLLKANED